MLQQIEHIVYDNFIQLLLTLVSVVLVPKIATWLKLKSDSVTRGYLETALVNGLRLAIKKLGGSIITKEDIIKEEKFILYFASSYVKDNVPAAVKALGIDSMQLNTILTARLVTISDQILKS